jgi:hypothetical protein
LRLLRAGAANPPRVARPLGRVRVLSARAFAVRVGFLVFALACCAPPSSAQRLFTHPAIGDTLDARERLIFQEFPDIAGFHHAVFVVMPDSSVTAKVTLMANGRPHEVVFPQFNTALRLRAWFDYDPSLLEKRKPARVKTVRLELADGRLMGGEILCVRDSGLVLCAVEPAGEQLWVVRNAEVRTIVLSHRDKLSKSPILGTIVGAGLGAFLAFLAPLDESGSESGDSEGGSVLSRAALIPLLTAVGAGAGFVIGSLHGVQKSGDETITSIEPATAKRLKKLARYPDYEPAYIKGIR